MERVERYIFCKWREREGFRMLSARRFGRLYTFYIPLSLGLLARPVYKLYGKKRGG